MADLNVTPRDPRTQYWVNTSSPSMEGRFGTVFSLSNGHIAVRGPEEAPAWGRSEFYVAGIYAGAPKELLGLHDPDHILSDPVRSRDAAIAEGNCLPTLANLPFPIGVTLAVGREAFSFDKSKILTNERLVDTESATVRRTLVFRDSAGRRTRVDSRRFASFSDKHLVCLEYAVTPLGHDAPVDVDGFLKYDASNANGIRLWRETARREEPGLKTFECVTHDTGYRVSIAQKAVVRREAGRTVLELFAAAGEIDIDAAAAHAEAAAAKGFSACLAEHTAAYRVQADAAAIAFDGDVPTQQGFNFGHMHLHMAFPYGDNRVSIPIKGMTSGGYRFAVFWDTDFHMFPYYVMTKPRDARALLEYRFNQLPAYRENARAWGAEGAQVPWETQRSGREATAPWLCLQEREIHISADAAYMFKMYDDLTPDHAVMIDMGARFVMETARFYASRMKWVPERGRYEMPGVGCPDQYHTIADNNVFISLMAKWNVEYALHLAAKKEYAPALAAAGVTKSERALWREKAASLFIHQPNADGIIEEFDGFFALSPDIDGISETYCSHSQAVKQPDVLAAAVHFEDLYPRDIWRRNWRFYTDRTIHGSSLSLPGTAFAAARAGLHDEALHYMARSARMDLDDVNMDTDRGIHLSGYALQWMTMVFGFAGLAPRRDCLHFEPSLPRQWESLAFNVHWQFQPLAVRVTKRDVTLDAPSTNDRPVAVRLGRGRRISIAPGQSVTLPLPKRRIGER